MRGKLSDQPVPDTARRLSNDEVTGALEVTGASGVARVFFRSGAVYWAMSPAPRARLGDRLVNAGFITQAQLDDALTQQQQSEQRTKLGALLVDQELVGRDVIRVFVQEQILDALFDLVRWDEGDWAFHPGDAVDDKLPIDVPVAQMLVEVARRQNEWDQIQRSIPTLDAVPDHVIGGNATTAALEQDEFTMLASIDGARSVRELASDLGYSEFEAGRIVYGLTLLGIVEILGEEGDEDDDDVAAAVEEPIDDATVADRDDLDAALADVLHATGDGDAAAETEAATEDEPIDVGAALEHALFGDTQPAPAPAPEPTPEPLAQPAAGDESGLQVTVHFALDDGVAERSAQARAPGSDPVPATPDPVAPAAPAAPAAAPGGGEPEPWVFSTDGDDAPEAAPAGGGDSDLEGLDDFFSGANPAPTPTTAELTEDLDALVAGLEDTPSPAVPPATDEPAATLPGASIQPQSPPAPEPAAEPAAPARGGGRADVSEFLRELTQLNVEGDAAGEAGEPDGDDADDPPPSAPSSRPEPRDDRSDDKKKKGLFGWGR